MDGIEKLNEITTITSNNEYTARVAVLGQHELHKVTSEKAANGHGKLCQCESTASRNKSKDNNEISMYECNICWETAKNSVVSICGHLYCWPCLHQWLVACPIVKACPVCNTPIDRSKIIPLYGRNSACKELICEMFPPRPIGQRAEADPWFEYIALREIVDDMHMSVGLGIFSLFNADTILYIEFDSTLYEDSLSNLLISLAYLCFAWLVFMT